MDQVPAIVQVVLLVHIHHDLLIHLQVLRLVLVDLVVEVLVEEVQVVLGRKCKV